MHVRETSFGTREVVRPPDGQCCARWGKTSPSSVGVVELLQSQLCQESLRLGGQLTFGRSMYVIDHGLVGKHPDSVSLAVAFYDHDSVVQVTRAESLLLKRPASTEQAGRVGHLDQKPASEDACVM